MKLSHAIIIAVVLALAGTAAFSATNFLVISGVLPPGVCLQATSDGFGATSSGAPCASPLTNNNTWTGVNTFGTVIGSHSDVSASGNIDLSATGGLCGKTIHYTGASAGTLTVLATAVPDCNATVLATSTGLVTIAAAGSGTFKSNPVCTATPRTAASGSAIAIHIISNSGSNPLITLAGDCG
jgi:hypothetical protein